MEYKTFIKIEYSVQDNVLITTNRIEMKSTIHVHEKNEIKIFYF